MRSALSRFCVPLVLAAALPAAAQNLNVDLGTGAGAPSSSYGAAAAQPGVWNSFGTGSFPLVGLGGGATGVTLLASADGVGTGGFGGGDSQALLGDNLFDCVDPDAWSFGFTGLANGIYALYVYAPSNGVVDTGTVTANGVLLTSMPGSEASTLIEGTSWKRAYVRVSAGVLDVGGAGTGASNCAGVSGVQLVGPIAVLPPATVALNVDFGAFFGAPSSGFGAAAGQTGTWNLIGIGSVPLLATSGALTGVTATVSADFATSNGGTGTGDTQALLGDNIIDCVDPDAWSVQLAGLPDGDFLLHVYAPSNGVVDTGTLTANGVVIPSLPGSLSSTLIEGTSWAATMVSVTGGTLSMAATNPGGVNCIGLSGFQLAGPIITVPALGSHGGAAALLALAAVAMLAAARRGSRARH